MREISSSERKRLHSMTIYETRLKRAGFSRIAGVDEAGRGPLAGPVVAACCILPEETLFANLNDSKQLSAEERDILYSEITSDPNLIYSVGVIDVETIDRVNILQATFLAMKGAINAMQVLPDYLLIDGNQLPSLEIPTEAIIDGDAISASVAAASIIAKVTRDRMMLKLDSLYPDYGFAQHKGYATEQHLKAIEIFGPCPIHRKSFDPIKTLLSPQINLF